MEGARYLLVDHPIQDATDDEMRAKAQAVVDPVVAALTLCRLWVGAGPQVAEFHERMKVGDPHRCPGFLPLA